MHYIYCVLIQRLSYLQYVCDLILRALAENHVKGDIIAKATVFQRSSAAHCSSGDDRQRGSSEGHQIESQREQGS